MKNIKIYLSVIIMGFLYSCNDATDITQKGELNASAAFRNLSDLRGGLSEVYDQLNVENAIAFTTVFTDEVGIGSQNGGQNLNDYRFVLNNTSVGPEAIWQNNYRVINYANRVLEGAEIFTPLPADLAAYNKVIAETRAIRAFAHFQLLTYFSTNLKDDNALGVILLDFVPQLTQSLPRATNGEVFALINADLDFAASNLGNTGPNDFKLVNQKFITALRARIAAYRGDYANALTFAQSLIDNTPLTVAGTTTNSPYINLFRDAVGAQGESIFTLDRPVGKTAIVSTWFFNAANLGGGPFLDMGRNLFNLLNATPGDIRRTAFVGATSVIDPNYQTNPNYRASDILVINKYPGKPNLPLLNDIKVFRVSEMYFIKAEALASSGSLNGATNSVASVLKQLRDARIVTGQPAAALPVYSSATEAWADILKERRIELCFEGHRYIDLKRLGTLAGVSIDRNIRDCDFNDACTLPVTDYRFTLPIPLTETRANSVIAAQQNPQY